ncbi:glyoxalase [bacterium]|jgi:uncharacterized protein|nr:glyoxalase [bacterium]
MTRPFHLALPTKKLKETEAFYTTILGCTIGRQDSTWIDFDFAGHQLVFHECLGIDIESAANPVDGKQVRVPHFGVILTMEDWKKLALRLKNHDIKFIIEPYIRFQGTPGEQATMFFEDNNGYALEMKAFENDDYIFKPFENIPI